MTQKELLPPRSCELTRPEAIARLRQLDFLIVRAMERASRTRRLPKHMRTTAIEGYMGDREAVKMAIAAIEKLINTEPDPELLKKGIVAWKE